MNVVLCISFLQPLNIIGNKYGGFFPTKENLQRNENSIKEKQDEERHNGNTLKGEM